MQLKTVKVEKPDDINFILGQTHFIKSVEAILGGESLMAKSNQRTARKPATKYPNLQKKLQKGKVKAGAAKRK